MTAMLADAHPEFLLASNSAPLIAALGASLHDCGEQVRAVASPQVALEAMLGEPVPCLVLIDAGLPGMPIEQLLAAGRAGNDDRRFPIVLISDDGMLGWKDRLAEGVIDDLFPCSMPPFHWRVRLEIVLRTFRHIRELEHLRETTALNHDTDPVTGLCNRAALLSMLFRETDRVQRMNTPLSLLLLDINDFGHWSAHLGAAGCDQLLKEVVGRLRRLLRSYDLFGRTGPAGFVLGLPGCTAVNAVALAERIRAEVFSTPFPAAGASLALTASYGIASSHGRSPLVVLREAEQALQAAKAAGPEMIRGSRHLPVASPAPADFLAAPAPVRSTTRWNR